MAVLSTGPSALEFLLDSNIISEMTRRQPHPGVVQNYEAHYAQLALPAPGWHEVQYGCLRLPPGQRRDALLSYLNQVMGVHPKLPYDATAALVHAQLRADGASRGRVLPLFDAQIAAIAITQGLTLVTRNTRDFQGLPGLRMVNWFED